VLIGELVGRRWYDPLLHGPRATIVRELLLRSGCPRVVVIDIPWYLDR